MKNILVSGASGIIGYGILRSLKTAGEELRLVGTTIYADSAAGHFCDIFEQAVPTGDSEYINWLLQIIHKHKIDLIIPGIEADMYQWAQHIPEIEKSGAKAVLNNSELIALCKDKWNFYQKLKESAPKHTIASSLTADYLSLSNDFGLPFLLKPRCGHGSKGIVQVDNNEIFLQQQDKMGAVLMAQPIVGNSEEEYSTSAFCDGNGGFYASMTIKRKLSKAGFTEKAQVVDVEDMAGVLQTLCSLFKPVGPTNFQFRRQDGILKLLEINPRISSATSIRTAFGYNESMMAVEYFLNNKKPVQPLIRKGTAVRYTDDLVSYE